MVGDWVRHTRHTLGRFPSLFTINLTSSSVSVCDKSGLRCMMARTGGAQPVSSSLFRLLA